MTNLLREWKQQLEGIAEILSCFSGLILYGT